ncbi:putative sucrose-phosphate phosphatase [Helianthus anomalus]
MIIIHIWRTISIKKLKVLEPYVTHYNIYEKLSVLIVEPYVTHYNIYQKVSVLIVKSRVKFCQPRCNAQVLHYIYITILVFLTGRSPTLYKQLMKEKSTLTPDITIMSVSTEIMYGNAMVLDGAGPTF